MKKFIGILSLIVFLGAGCNANQQSPQQNINTSTETKKAETQKYTNSTYGFSVDIPKETYVEQCDAFQPVTVTENKGTIDIGSTFSCDSIEPNTFFGYKLYASKNISDLKSADAFVKKYLGAGCKAVRWDTTYGFAIENISGDSGLSMGKIEKECPFIFSKYHVEYSNTLKTAVFWSITQEIQFYNKQGAIEGLQNFQFTK